MKSFKLLLSLILTATLYIFSFQITLADHSWGNYHWARTANPFTLTLGDNLTPAWKPYLNTTSNDWTQSSVLDTVIAAGRTNPKNCRAVAGRIEVCNNKYGKNGWLGVAQVWVSGEHITQGTTKVNDTYFNTAKYNTPAWKNLVLCQEVGHVFGLDHQDEDFGNTNLNTCMDYTSNPESNQHPNDHDYEQLALIYTHLDGFTTILSGAATKTPFGQTIQESMETFEHRSDWGKSIEDNGRTALFERTLSNGQKVFTHVIWAE